MTPTGTSTDATIPSLEVLEPGMQALLQDGGRLAHQHAGVSRSGCMDIYAAAWANRLVGNPRQAVVVEIALGGFKARAHTDVWLALAGAELPITVAGQALACWSRFKLKAGQLLELGFARSGQRAYLAVAGGGFHVEPVLGSAATHVRNRLGGLDKQGTPLKRGDVLACQHAGATFSGSARAPWRSIPDYRTSMSFRIQPGGDFKRLSHAAQQQLFATSWQVSPQSDRMGVRLTSPTPITEWLTRTFSLGIAPGAIQLPPSGEPIVLMADCQTMGGYPIIGWLNPLDLGRLAQMPARSEVTFVAQTVGAMQQDMAQFHEFFDQRRVY